MIVFHVCLCFAVLSVPCSLVSPAGKGADLLALLHFVFFLCVFFTVPYVSWSISDLGVRLVLSNIFKPSSDFY